MKTRSGIDIAIIILLKLMALFALWFFFVRGHVIAHSAEDTTYHILSDTIAQRHNP